MNFYIDIENLLLMRFQFPRIWPERDNNQNVILPWNLIEVESDNRTQ